MSGAPVALVIGASRGLGFAVAEKLGAMGYHVVAMARTVGGLEELADRIEAVGGQQPTLVPLSLTDHGGLQRMCLAIHERWGRLDLAVHCAAFASIRSPVAHTSDKDFEQAVDINIHGLRRMAYMLQPLLEASASGRFIYVADDRAGQPFFGAYGATKEAARCFVASWAAETEKLSPSVQIFTPKPMATALRHRFYPGQNPSDIARCDDEAERLIQTCAITPALLDQ